jgi:hypothetical protein
MKFNRGSLFTTTLLLVHNSPPHTVYNSHWGIKCVCVCVCVCVASKI